MPNVRSDWATRTISTVSNDELHYLLQQARRRIADWVQAKCADANAADDTGLVRAVQDWAGREYALRLETAWDGGASHFDARWVRGSSVARWFQRPLSGPTAGHAELVACANLIEVLDGIEHEEA